MSMSVMESAGVLGTSEMAMVLLLNLCGESNVVYVADVLVEITPSHTTNMSFAYQFEKVGFNECATVAFCKRCGMNRFTTLLAIKGESVGNIVAPLLYCTIGSTWILCNDGLILQSLLECNGSF